MRKKRYEVLGCTRSWFLTNSFMLKAFGFSSTSGPSQQRRTGILESIYETYHWNLSRGQSEEALQKDSATFKIFNPPIFRKRKGNPNSMDVSYRFKHLLLYIAFMLNRTIAGSPKSNEKEGEKASIQRFFFILLFLLSQTRIIQVLHILPSSSSFILSRPTSPFNK